MGRNYRGWLQTMLNTNETVVIDPSKRDIKYRVFRLNLNSEFRVYPVIGL